MQALDYVIMYCLLIINTCMYMGGTCEKNYTMKPRNVLPEHYVKEIRPPSDKTKPVIIDFSIYVVDINSINVEDMDFRQIVHKPHFAVEPTAKMRSRVGELWFSRQILLWRPLEGYRPQTDYRHPFRLQRPPVSAGVDMFVEQQWTESRLNMPDNIFEEGDDYVTLPPQFFDNLWQPDPYFLNTKVVEIATLTHKFSSVTLYRNKTVRYSSRINAIVACQMEFQMFPMDVQRCPIYIESFSYNNNKVRFRWSKKGVSVNPDLKLLQYHIGLPLKLDETNEYLMEKQGNFSRLTVYFCFERQIGHHLIQTFTPSALVVVLSWFSFWLGLDAIPGRVTLLVTCMLTLVTMFTGLKSDIPPVAYVKALDLWMAGCMVFVFAALAEFVVVKVLDNKYQNKKTSVDKISRIIPMHLTQLEKVTAWDSSSTLRCRQTQSASNLTNHQSHTPHFIQLAWLDHETGMEKVLWQEIDKSSRVIFPVLFLLFMVLYWPVLLLKKQ